MSIHPIIPRDDAPASARIRVLLGINKDGSLKKWKREAMRKATETIKKRFSEMIAEDIERAVLADGGDPDNPPLEIFETKYHKDLGLEPGDIPRDVLSHLTVGNVSRILDMAHDHTRNEITQLGLSISYAPKGSLLRVEEEHANGDYWKRAASPPDPVGLLPDILECFSA